MSFFGSQGSSVMIHPAETAGKKPKRRPLAKFSVPLHVKFEQITLCILVSEPSDKSLISIRHIKGQCRRPILALVVQGERSDVMISESPVIIDSALEIDLAVLAPACRSVPDRSFRLRYQILLSVSLSSGKIIWKTLREFPAAVIETVIRSSHMS